MPGGTFFSFYVPFRSGYINIVMQQHNPNSQVAGEVPPPVEWLPTGTLRLIDQTLLPGRFEYFDCHSTEDLAHAIRTLKVRGAPAIGVAAAYGLCLVASHNSSRDPD